MSFRNRNIIFPGPDCVIWEGSHALLNKSYVDQFGRQMYDINILRYTTWTATPELYWAKYSTGHGAWGPNGLDSLIGQTQSVNEQAQLAHENRTDIPALVNLVKSNRVNWHMAYDVSGYYINGENGYFCGPNKHSGYVI
jgi:hypothetical protein